MKRSITFVAAAAFALSGLTFLPVQAADIGGAQAGQGTSNGGVGDNQQGGGQTPDQNNNASAANNANPGANGDQNGVPSGPAVSDSQAKSIDKTLADTVESAVEKNGFSDLISYLNQADQQRLKDDSKNANFDDLNAAAAQLQQDWNNKYGHDFKIDDSHQTFASAQIYQGDIGSQARTAGETMAPQANNSNGTPDNSQANRTDANLATAVINASNMRHRLVIRLSNEGTVMDSWKIDLPQQYSADQLKAALVQRLNGLHNNVDRWPTDEAQAQRVVSTQILAALVHAGRTAQSGANGTSPDNAPSGNPTPNQ